MMNFGKMILRKTELRKQSIRFRRLWEWVPRRTPTMDFRQCLARKEDGMIFLRTGNSSVISPKDHGKMQHSEQLLCWETEARYRGKTVKPGVRITKSIIKKMK